MRDRLKALRRRVMQLGVGRGRRYPLRLRADVLLVVAEAREVGWSWDDLGTELDISVETLGRWSQDARRESVPAMVPVEIESDAVSALTHGGLSVITPSGFRIEGLEVEEAARLIRALS